MVDLRPNYGGGNEDNSYLLQNVLCTHCCIQCPCPCCRPSLIHTSAADSWTLMDKSGWASCDHRKSRWVSEKHQLLLNWLCQSLWLCGSQQTGKFFKRREYQNTLPASWETCMQVKKQQLELGMEQWTGSKLGKEYIKAVYSHPAYLTYMQSTSCKIPG